MTPETNIPAFSSGEILTAARLEQMRQTLVSLVRAWEAEHGPLDGSPPQRVFAVELAGAHPSRGGIWNGRVFRPPIQPAESGDLDSAHLGSAAPPSGSSDVEVWDVAELPDMRVGHLLGYNAQGKPILVIDAAGGLPTPQYQGMALMGVTDGEAAYAFPFAVATVPV